MADRYQPRRKRLQQRLRREGLPGLLVSDIHNIGYLTGFTGSAAQLIITPEDTLLLSDTRYEIQLADECPELQVEIRDARDAVNAFLARQLKRLHLSHLAVESHRLTKADFDQLAAALAGVELVDTQGWVEDLRAIKDRTEIAAIRRAIDVAQRGFQVIMAQLTGDQTELQIAHNLEHQMRAFGARGCAFDPIVGVGARAALPHGKPSSVQAGEAPFLLMDWGAEVQGYLSDLTRMIVTGKVSAQFRRVYETVLAAQLAAIDAIRPGATFQEVDRAAREVIEAAGFGKRFGHGTGHSFGLQIHELPYLSPIHEGQLEPGMVVTVEPGIYLPGKLGVRLEDDVLVTPDGAEVLSNLPKDLEECRADLGGP